MWSNKAHLWAGPMPGPPVYASGIWWTLHWVIVDSILGARHDPRLQGIHNEGKKVKLVNTISVCMMLYRAWNTSAGLSLSLTWDVEAKGVTQMRYSNSSTRQRKEASIHVGLEPGGT